MGSNEKIVELFPTPIFRDNISRQFTQDEMDCFLSAERKVNVGNISSKEQYILRNTVLSPLHDLLEQKVKEYFQLVYNPAKDVNIYITQSWLNYSEVGQHHHRHCHPNSIVSGVLYIDASAKSDKIHFYRREYPQISIKPIEYTQWNSNSWWLPVKTGDLLLFPSSLDHMVEPIEEDEARTTRISIAFNTFVNGIIGNYEDSSELIL